MLKDFLLSGFLEKIPLSIVYNPQDKYLSTCNYNLFVSRPNDPVNSYHGLSHIGIFLVTYLKKTCSVRCKGKGGTTF